MRHVRLAVILPVVFCGIEGLLWYWNLHSIESIPTSCAGFRCWITPETALSTSLDFPAYFLWGLLNRDPPGGLGFLLCAAGAWCLIGNWLDHRGEVKDKSKPEGVLSRFLFPALDIMLPPLVVLLGLSAFIFSYSVHMRQPIENFIQTIQIALLQTWAVFLIGIPAVGIVRHFLEIRRKKESSGSPSRPRRRISNFRLLEMIVGVFATLVLLWLPPGPLIPK